MKFLSATSSFVFIGEFFGTNLFDVFDLKNQNLFGTPDETSTIAPPGLAQISYPDRGYLIYIRPERIDIKYTKQKNNFGNPHYQCASIIADNIIKSGEANCKGFGLNFDVIINSESIGMTGLEFCKKYFVKIDKLSEKLGKYESFNNTATMFYYIGETQYKIVFTPQGVSHGEHLVVQINAHRDVSSNEEMRKALTSNFKTIKLYLLSLHENLFKGIIK